VAHLVGDILEQSLCSLDFGVHVCQLGTNDGEVDQGLAESEPAEKDLVGFECKGLEIAHR
jgi:hypothetical protein